MTTELAIEAPDRAPGNSKPSRVQRASQPVSRAAVAVPPIARTDPAVGVAVPGRSAARAYRRRWGSRYGLVDGIVTLGTIVGFTVALALMGGEWLGAPTASTAQAVVTKVAPAATPTVATGPTIEPRAAPRPL